MFEIPVGGKLHSHLRRRDLFDHSEDSAQNERPSALHVVHPRNSVGQRAQLLQRPSCTSRLIFLHGHVDVMRFGGGVGEIVQKFIAGNGQRHPTRPRADGVIIGSGLDADIAIFQRAMATGADEMRGRKAMDGVGFEERFGQVKAIDGRRLIGFDGR